ncbi:MAG: glycosyltransferase [Candidatus Hodarchaeota archaeon]
MTFGTQTIDYPTVSVILPVGSDNLNVYLCLESLVQQRYNNLELIVVDNGMKRKTLDKISRILAKTDFMSFVWKQEYLRRRRFWTGNEQIHGDLIFLASPYVVYDRECIKNLVSKLQEDQNIKTVNPERLSGFKSKSLAQKCLITIESSIKHQGDAFGGTSTNGILFWRENIEEVFYWDLIQDGYLETGVKHLQKKWSHDVTVRDAKCQPIQPQSFLEFFKSVYLEARYNRPHLPFRTHTDFSAILIVLLVFVGVIMEILFSGSYELFSGQVILTFLIPLYAFVLLPRLLSWKNIERKWTLLFIPVLRILSAFVYVLGILQKHFRFEKILATVVNAPETTILPTAFVLLLLKNVGYTLAIRIILQSFYLGFILSLTLFKGSKLFNHLFYGVMLSTPVNIILTWIQHDRILFSKIPPLLLALMDPIIVCLIIGSLVYFQFLVKRV